MVGCVGLWVKEVLVGVTGPGAEGTVVGAGSHGPVGVGGCVVIDRGPY